ncbi:MAG: IS5 family transposase [Caldilineaceae bacterium]|nr:IS5 family transposase [Caldilineaceae bacterium]
MRSGRLQKRGRQNEQCPGRSRGGFSSKIHLLVDAPGFPLQFILTGGERHDLSQAETLLAPFHFDAVIAEKGYSSDPLRELLAARQVELIIPSRRYRRQPRDYYRIRYKERNIVERFINRIKWNRSIFTRNENLARRFMAFLHFAATLIWLERNVNEPLVPYPFGAPGA